MRERLHLQPKADGQIWLYRPSEFERRSHRHEELEANLVVRGTARYLMASRRYDLKPGSLVWLFPDQEHLLIDESPDFTTWIAVWRRRLVRHAAPAECTLRQRAPAGDFCRAIARPEIGRAVQLLQEIEQQEHDLPRRNAGLAYLLMSLWSLFEAAGEGSAKPLHASVEAAIELVRREGEDISLNALAGRVGLSASRLSRLFKQQTGLTLVHFRQRIALERFLRMYDPRDGKTLLSSALAAGFGSYAQFHRVYKRVLRCSPRVHAGAPLPVSLD